MKHFTRRGCGGGGCGEEARDAGLRAGLEETIRAITRSERRMLLGLGGRRLVKTEVEEVKD